MKILAIASFIGGMTVIILDEGPLWLGISMLVAAFIAMPNEGSR